MTSQQRFLLALAAMLAGVALYALGQNEPGMLLIGAAVGVIAPMAKKAPPGAALLLAFLLVGCTPGKVYLAADKGIFDVITPEYSAYVEADEKLDAEQKARRLRTVAAWKLLIEKAGDGND